MTSMRQNGDRRKFLRMEIDTDITFRYLNAPKVYGGIGKNLSSGGIAFDTNEPVQEGTTLQITVKPAIETLSPFEATAEVIRSFYDENEALYAVAAKFIEQ